MVELKKKKTKATYKDMKLKFGDEYWTQNGLSPLDNHKYDRYPLTMSNYKVQCINYSPSNFHNYLSLSTVLYDSTHINA